MVIYCTFAVSVKEEYLLEPTWKFIPNFPLGYIDFDNLHFSLFKNQMFWFSDEWHVNTTIGISILKCYDMKCTFENKEKI